MRVILRKTEVVLSGGDNMNIRLELEEGEVWFGVVFVEGYG